jgi:hypothetical protein
MFKLYKMDLIEKEKLKDAGFATLITGLTWYFITQDERVGLIGGISGGVTTYTQHDQLNPFIIRIKKSYDPDWWIKEGGWDGTRLENDKGGLNPEQTIIDKEITAGDIGRYVLAPFTFGFSLRF